MNNFSICINPTELIELPVCSVFEPNYSKNNFFVNRSLALETIFTMM